MSFDQPWLLWLLPLAALPWLAQPGDAIRNAWVQLAPRDRASDAIGITLRLAASLALVALVIGIADPYRPEYAVERIGRGAEIVLVLDRSRSMDQGFAGASRSAAAPRGNGPEALEFYASQSPARLRDSKGKVARQLLGDFAARRPDDRFAMIAFSALPIRMLAFTQKREAIQAAIAAGNIGRGLSETNIGLALIAALGAFEERPYTGSRIVMLVSDGGDRLDPEARERIAHLVRKHRVALYWLYLRSANGPGLAPQAGEASPVADTVPEHLLHAYFESLSTPYRAYEAGDTQALKSAIDAVDKFENLPITYLDTLPRRDLSTPCFALAFGCVVLLLAASAVELRRWV
jgi:mxaC protein